MGDPRPLQILLPRRLGRSRSGRPPNICTQISELPFRNVPSADATHLYPHTSHEIKWWFLEQFDRLNQLSVPC